MIRAKCLICGINELSAIATRSCHEIWIVTVSRIILVLWITVVSFLLFLFVFMWFVLFVRTVAVVTGWSLFAVNSTNWQFYWSWRCKRPTCVRWWGWISQRMCLKANNEKYFSFVSTKHENTTQNDEHLIYKKENKNTLSYQGSRNIKVNWSFHVFQLK